jgi:cbb3-type cytochrome oxidase subunit 3
MEGTMFKDVLARMDLAAAPSLVLVVFFAIFAGVLAWVAFGRHERHFERMNELPLDGGEVER